MRLDPDGRPLLAASEDANDLQKHFATHEQGRHDDNSLLGREYDEQGLGPAFDAPRPVQNAMLRDELTFGFRKLAKGKVPGPSGLHGEVFGAAPFELSK